MTKTYVITAHQHTHIATHHHTIYNLLNYTYTFTIYQLQLAWVIDIPSTLLIKDYCLLKMHHVAYCLQTRERDFDHAGFC